MEQKTNSNLQPRDDFYGLDLFHFRVHHQFQYRHERSGAIGI